MASCIAFHSYKGGTGKTTIAANLAALLAKKGYRVFLLDLDVYAPSLQAYFDKEPKRWINDFLNGTADVGDVIMDLTPAIEEVTYDSSNTLKQKQKPKEKITGKLWVGFCSSRKEEIYKLEGGGKQDTSKIQLLRRFILLREQLISLHDADYIIIDTSPGIRYWSINALAVADTLFLTLKMGDLDIDGTRKMAEEIYGSFTKFGAKSYLVMNRVAGYCIPQHISDATVPLPPSSAVRIDGGSGSTASTPASQSSNRESASMMQQQKDESNILTSALASDIRMDIISSIACYCDIQFSNKEFLTVLKYPDHPFAKQFELLAQTIEGVQSKA
ncbi:MAG TPA: ParA family protein [Nitrososphaeraceae archaeon]|jgi:MinD-like ATPase involved in chromosome partitioning or flagellar assembly